MTHRALTEDWEFNVLSVYNYRNPGQFGGFYRFITENHDRVAGDVCEFGVYRGSSLLATALLLKELGSNKLVWGFDSFSGFPSYHPNDDLAKFDELLRQGVVSEQHHARVQRNIQLKSLTSTTKVDVTNISSSGDFSKTSLDLLQEKIRFLGLDNIRLVVGDFGQTLTSGSPEGPTQICAALVDCDLYQGYKDVLPYTWSRLQRGGYIHLDEYYSLKFPGARIATNEFFADKLDKPQQHETLRGQFERWFVRRVFS